MNPDINETQIETSGAIATVTKQLVTAMPWPGFDNLRYSLLFKHSHFVLQQLFLYRTRVPQMSVIVQTGY